MAVTRIKNNQITDATVVANTKLVNYSISSNKLANNLVYGSDLTVSGNLIVNGTTTTIDTVNTLIQDPLITLADGQTSGTPTVDIGLIGLRGNQLSSFIGWKESDSAFVTALSNTTVSNTTANVTQYANLITGNLSVVGNVIGSVSFSGNLTAGNLISVALVEGVTVSASGNVIGGNVNTAGLISATGNVLGGNIDTAGLVSATGNLIGGNVTTAGLISATGNITGGNVNFGAGIVSGTGNIYADTIFANISGNIDAAGSNTEIQFNGPGDILAANANFTYDFATNLMTVNNGNIATGNLSATGQVNATANITGGNVLTGGLVSATGNVTGGNLLTAGLISATGNVDGGNVLTAGLISAGGNITSATNVNTPNVVATGNLELSGGNILLTPATGNIVVNNTNINGVAQPVQSNDVATKIYVDNMVSTQIAYHPAVFAATTANLATITGGTITYNQPNGAGNGIGATITTTGSFDLIDTANVQTPGTRILVKNEGNAVLNGAYVWSNATVITRSTDADQYGPNSSEELSINDYFFVQSGNVNAGSAWIVDSPSGEITFGTSNIAFAQFSSSQTYTGGNGISLYGTVISTVYDNSTIGINGSNQLYIPANAPLTTPNIGAATGTSLSVTGDITANTNLSAVANVVAGNVTTAGLISATGNITTADALNGANLSLSGNVLSALNVTGNITGGNLLTPGLVSATGNVDGGNINTAGLASVTGNVIGGNVTTAGLVSATGNVDGGNINTAGLISATGNINGGNILTGGLISATGNLDSANVNTGNISLSGNVISALNVTGNITGGNVTGVTAGQFGNIVISGDDITDTNGRVNINTAGADVDFAVNGDTVANVFYVDAANGTAAFGSSQTYVNAIVSMNTTTSVKLPAGTTSERPSNASSYTGMIRFNTTSNGLEVYDNSEWTEVGGTTFTLISDEQFNGDGSTVAFTLASTQTTNSCIVSINGVVQIPGSAYSVAGTDPTCVLTFTEAPASGDLIDVRELTTTTTVTAIQNNSGNATVTGNSSAAQIDILGNLVPSGNVTYSLGSDTNYWKSLYVGGNTIYLGGLQLQSAAGNVFSVTSDGSTPATIANVTISGTGNVTGGNLIATTALYTPSIVNSGSNGVGNIGSSTTYFNTVFAKATSAQYADLAEKYVADAEYAPGTVVSFGGAKEVTQSTVDADRAVAGVISTNPSYIMNAALDAEHVAVVAFTGRVPTKVTGTVAKGDLMVSNGDGTARADADPKAGSIIGKALENFDGATGTIEVVIGRF